MFLFCYHNGHTFPTQVNSSTVTVFSRSIKDGTGIITSLFNTQRMVGWKIVKRQTPLVFMLYDFSSVISSPGSIINLVHLSIHKVLLQSYQEEIKQISSGNPDMASKLEKIGPNFQNFNPCPSFRPGHYFWNSIDAKTRFPFKQQQKARHNIAT